MVFVENTESMWILNDQTLLKKTRSLDLIRARIDFQGIPEEGMDLSAANAILKADHKNLSDYGNLLLEVYIQKLLELETLLGMERPPRNENLEQNSKVSDPEKKSLQNSGSDSVLKPPLVKKVRVNHSKSVPPDASKKLRGFLELYKKAEIQEKVDLIRETSELSPAQRNLALGSIFRNSDSVPIKLACLQMALEFDQKLYLNLLDSDHGTSREELESYLRIAPFQA